MLKVTTRTPRSTWASPSMSRACSQGRWRRRWVRPRVLGRLVSERLESLGDGIMPAARLPAPRSASPGAWEHLRGAQGPVLPPLHPLCSRAHQRDGSPGAWPRASSWAGAQGRGVAEGSRGAPSPPRAPDGHRARDGDEDAGAPAHRISLENRGAEKGRSRREEKPRSGIRGKGREGKGKEGGKKREGVVGSETVRRGEAGALPAAGPPSPLRPNTLRSPAWAAAGPARRRGRGGGGTARCTPGAGVGPQARCRGAGGGAGVGRGCERLPGSRRPPASPVPGGGRGEPACALGPGAGGRAAGQE